MSTNHEYALRELRLLIDALKVCLFPKRAISYFDRRYNEVLLVAAGGSQTIPAELRQLTREVIEIGMLHQHWRAAFQVMTNNNDHVHDVGHLDS
jgi:hypothetical protein